MAQYFIPGTGAVDDGGGSGDFFVPGVGAVSFAATGHTLVGANSSQANTSGTGAVTQDHALVGANCSQANSSGTGSIAGGGNHSLVGANSSQANTSGTGAVSQVHTLVGANSSQSNLSGTGSITGAGTFTTTSAMVNNTGTPWLGQAVVWAWYQGGRVGSAPTSVTYGSGTTHSTTGTLTVSGLPAGAGYLMAAKQNTDATDDYVYYEAGTVS